MRGRLRRNPQLKVVEGLSLQVAAGESAGFSEQTEAAKRPRSGCAVGQIYAPFTYSKSNGGKFVFLAEASAAKDAGGRSTGGVAAAPGKRSSCASSFRSPNSRAPHGQKVAFERDNCPADLGGAISFIAGQRQASPGSSGAAFARSTT
jgi:hypothetical protein